VQAMKLVRISEHVRMGFFPCFGVSNPPPEFVNDPIYVNTCTPLFNDAEILKRKLKYN
jgi:hypothetical protein